ncbi:MAG TPA: T9SS type A sorting domain-containing protein [Bacteroidia bacterium]|nr:T9SS type A sorting domain-containing protein [Bacteroidia bacterium]
MKIRFSSLVFFILFYTISQAQIPQLWGTNSFGGSFGIGTLYRINGDGTGYSSSYNMSSGSTYGTLSTGPGNILFGTTVSGGVSGNLGSIFSYNAAQNTYTTLFSMDSFSGYYPHQGLLLASNSLFYGLTSQGGSANEGVLFSYNPQNGIFTKLQDLNSTNGYYPEGGLAEGPNGKLYGVATAGGLNSSGTLFSYNLSGGMFTVEHDFIFAGGFSPWGKPVLYNNMLYGMTFGGGTLGYGLIYSFDPATSTFAAIHYFNGTDGSAPTGPLCVSPAGILYGNTSQGGANNGGVIFEFDLNSGVYTKLHDYADSTGWKPMGGLMIASDGNLYGNTNFGGANSFGAVIKYDLSSGTYLKLHDCSVSEGGFPRGELIEYNAPSGTGELPSQHETITIGPNPSSGTITIDFKHTTAPIHIELFTISGKKIWQSDYLSYPGSVNLNEPAGVYFLKITSGSYSQTGKLIFY